MMKLYLLFIILSFLSLCAYAMVGYGLLEGKIEDPFTRILQAHNIMSGAPILVQCFDTKEKATRVIQIRSLLASMAARDNDLEEIKAAHDELLNLLKNVSYKMSSELTAEELKRSTYHDCLIQAHQDYDQAQREFALAFSDNIPRNGSSSGASTLTYHHIPQEVLDMLKKEKID